MIVPEQAQRWIKITNQYPIQGLIFHALYSMIVV
jgi:hypothetical protein